MAEQVDKSHAELRWYKPYTPQLWRTIKQFGITYFKGSILYLPKRNEYDKK